MRVLIVSYYWPPSGGAGVQRWVKLSKYLVGDLEEVHVVTVDEASASYMQLDHSLEKDVAPSLTVHKTKSFEPINIYSRIVGKSKVPTAGFSNVNNRSLAQKAVNAFRSNFFIPDPRKGWNKYAYRAAKQIITERQIDVVITTSPPHSSQLIGLRLKRALGIRWIADLRDPWTDIYYYSILGHSKLSRYLDEQYEKKVLLEADHIITISEKLRELWLEKDESLQAEKFSIIPNGFDPADFVHEKVADSSCFTIAYTGTMSEQYNPLTFFAALDEVAASSTEMPVKVQLIGKVSDQILRQLKNHRYELDIIQTVPHSEVVRLQKNADALLLVIPNVERAEGILTGKIFEYLATRNPIIGVGPADGDAAAILRDCQLGTMYDWTDQDGLKVYLHQLVADFRAGKQPNGNEAAIGRFSRKEQAKELLDLFYSTLTNR